MYVENFIYVYKTAKRKGVTSHLTPCHSRKQSSCKGRRHAVATKSPSEGYSTLKKPQFYFPEVEQRGSSSEHGVHSQESPMNLPHGPLPHEPAGRRPAALTALGSGAGAPPLPHSQAAQRKGAKKPLKERKAMRGRLFPHF